MKIKNVFIIITPFQYKVMKKLFKKTIYASDTVIFYTKIVNIDSNHIGEIEKLGFTSFSIDALKKEPFKYIPFYRNEFKKIRVYILKKLESYDFSDKLKIIIGTDKDNFTQIFLNILYAINNLNIELSAIEEGSGFYRKEKIKDKLLSTIYKLLTPILFSEKIQYHKQLGTDKRIDKVYARIPESIPKNSSSNKVSYIKYSLNTKRIFDEKLAKDILIFSFPNRNYNINDKQQIKILQNLVNRLGKGEKVMIKPHPREPLHVVSAITNAHIINQLSSGEDLDYFKFKKIINFNSSVVIDLLSSGYQKERIYTINLDNSDIAFFEETHYINIKDINKI